MVLLSMFFIIGHSEANVLWEIWPCYEFAREQVSFKPQASYLMLQLWRKGGSNTVWPKQFWQQ